MGTQLSCHAPRDTTSIPSDGSYAIGSAPLFRAGACGCRVRSRPGGVRGHSLRPAGSRLSVFVSWLMLPGGDTRETSGARSRRPILAVWLNPVCHCPSVLAARSPADRCRDSSHVVMERTRQLGSTSRPPLVPRAFAAAEHVGTGQVGGLQRCLQCDVL